MQYVPKADGIIGVSDPAVLVTATGDGTLLDRRRAELVDEGLPKIPHHSEAQRLPLDEAVRWWSGCGRRPSGMRRASGRGCTLPGRIGCRPIATAPCRREPPVGDGFLIARHDDGHLVGVEVLLAMRWTSAWQ